MVPGDSDDEDEDRENLVGEIEDSGSIFSTDKSTPQTRNEFTDSRITYGFKSILLLRCL